MGLGGFGGGVDVVKFAHKAGAEVAVTDLKPEEKLRKALEQLKDLAGIRFRLGSHSADDFEQADIVIANPAVPDDNEFLRLARAHGKFVTSQVNIFFELCPALIVGVTGANGKSTTAALAAHLLCAGTGQSGFAFRRVWLSGNIGNAPMLEALEQIRSNDLVVLELSSFQLEQLAWIEKAPHIAVLTNLTPNHLDRHGSFENYCAVKENIFRFQRPSADEPAVSLFNGEDRIASQWFEKYKGQPGRVCIRFFADDVPKRVRDKFNLPGRANLANLAAAWTIAKYFDVDDERIEQALTAFKSLPHRLELVATVDGIRWFNDSISTTPASSIVALEAFEDPKIIIAGGYDKALPFDQLGAKIAADAKAAILTGTTAHKIAEAIRTCPQNRARIEFTDSLAAAVEKAHELAEPGDVVLLSPACASYDMFDNFEHRGREFVRLVRNLSR